jgi:hypothetical protein
MDTGASPIRRLGDGYEPHVDEDAAGLTYSLPVDSGAFSTSFSFRITPGDLDVLRSDAYRRATLYMVAHTVLQRSMIRGQQEVSPEQFDGIAASVLHSPRPALEDYIDRIDREHNQVTRIFIDRVLARATDRGNGSGTP